MVLARSGPGDLGLAEVLYLYCKMVVAAEVAVAPHNLEIVLGMVPASWKTVHVGLAEALTVLQSHEMTGDVAEVVAAG